MKLNKIISLVLSFGIILSAFAGIMTVNADVADFAFKDVAVNGSFNEELGGTWAISGSASGSLTIEDDTKDSSNKVLRYDGTGNTGTYSYINYATATANHTYYMSLKVRVAETDSTSGNMYLYANSLGGEAKAYYSSTRPKITKDGWAICSGIVTPTSNNIGFKVISDQTKSSSNLKNAIYEIDDFVLYDLTAEGCYQLTLPADVSIVSGAFTSNSKTYAKSNNPVVLNYEGTDKTVAAGTATVTKTGNTYTFTMPGADTTVTLVDPPMPAFTNLVVNSDMEDLEAKIMWNKASATEGCVISIVEDTDPENPGNHVLRYDGSNITAGTTSYMAYPNLLTENKSYYYSYKIRMADVDANTGDLFAYNQNHTGTNDVARPTLTKEWATRSGVFTAKATSYNFKIISERDTSSTNVKNAIYEIDDVVIYDFANIHEFYLPGKTEMIQGGRALSATTSTLDTTTKFYAEKGSEVKFSYSGDKELTADVDLTSDGNVYSFIMADFAVNVSEVKDINFSMVEEIPNITVASPQSFVVIAAKYTDSKELAEVYFADIETTVNKQTISLADIAEFKEITEWTNMYLFVWNSLTEMMPLSDPFICVE